MAITVNTLRSYIENDMNILISGDRGTGKTQMTKKAVKLAGLKPAYFSTPTFDPYVEIMGVPVPRIEEDKEAVLEFVKVARMGDVEVLILDEINRASSETLNMIFEVLDSGEVNGARLGNVKSVVAMINPNNGDYIGVSDLDPALLDRFDVFLESDGKASLSHMSSIFTPNVARELVKWHDAHRSNKKNGYISPRRLEKIGSNWMKISTKEMIDSTIPPGVNAAVNELYLSLTTALKIDNGEIKIVPSISNKQSSSSRSNRNVQSMKKNTIDLKSGDIRLSNIIYKYENMDHYTIRGRVGDFKKAFVNHKVVNQTAETQKIVETVLRGYVHSVSSDKILSTIGWALIAATPAQMSVYMSSMTPIKRREFERATVSADHIGKEIHSKI